MRKSLGFCHEHAWLLLDKSLGDDLSIAIIYHDILGTILKQLPNTSISVPSQSKKISWFRRIPSWLTNSIELVSRVITPKETCLACQQRENATRFTMDILAESFSNKDFFDALASSDSLCLPHLKKAFEKVKTEEDFNSLLSISREKLRNLEQELAEYIRKNDYRFRREDSGLESDSWKRAVRMAVGDDSHQLEKIIHV